jgi:hypothetical protein
MIENLKQIEDRMLLDLLVQTDKWNTLLVNYYPPTVERCWIQLGNYRLLLHFIHECKPEEALFHTHRYPSAMHILTGKYEMGLGFGEGTVPPEKMATILFENGGYYDMTHIDGWHYVRPIGGPCATVMLTGKMWDREETVKDYPKLGPLTEQKKLIMLKWFEEYYRNRVHVQKITENEQIKKGDWVKLDVNAMSSGDKRGLEQYVNVLGFVIGREGNFIDVRFKNDRTKIHSRNLELMSPSDKPANVEAEKKKMDDMDPANWEDD